MVQVTPEALTNAGERMIVGNMWGYWAHLSIYHFALPFALGKRVLDAGSGSGYGAAYLARRGAQVLALDAGELAILHSRERYAGDPVTFEVADLNVPLPAGDEVFDLVFSSNVFEHVGNVDGLAAECARVVKPEGTVIIAVPPITSAEVMAADMENQFHVHHIPPSAWMAKLERFFTEVRCHAHYHSEAFSDPETIRREQTSGADKVTIRETDFVFPETEATALGREPYSITAVFVCRGRRAPPLPETLAERTPAAWWEGVRAAALIGRLTGERDSAVARAHAAEARLEQMTLHLPATEAFASKTSPGLEPGQTAHGIPSDHAAQLYAVIDKLRADLEQAERRRSQAIAEVEMIRGSTSWRVTGVLRAFKRAVS